MVSVEQIFEYYPELSETQREQFSKLESIYMDWNSKINVISRNDAHNFWTRHVLHSLSIAKFIDWKDGTQVLDLGTGGGFPSIPLAILYPEVQFTSIDGTAKKIMVLNDVVQQLGLKNVVGIQKRAEEHKGKYDFIITRAVSSMRKLLDWSIPLCSTTHINNLPNGIIALKGGNLKEELAEIPKSFGIEEIALSDYFQEALFAEKYLLYIAI